MDVHVAMIQYVYRLLNLAQFTQLGMHTVVYCNSTDCDDHISIPRPQGPALIRERLKKRVRDRKTSTFPKPQNTLDTTLTVLLLICASRCPCSCFLRAVALRPPNQVTVLRDR